MPRVRTEGLPLRHVPGRAPGTGRAPESMREALGQVMAPEWNAACNGILEKRMIR